MTRFQNELLDIADSLSELDIDLSFNENGMFVFKNELDFNQGIDIIEEIVGPFGFIPYEDFLTVRVLEGTLQEQKCTNYFNTITEDYNNNKLNKEDYEYLLEDLKEYLESYEQEDVDLEEDMLSEEALDETYSDEELDSFVNKTYNQQRVINIYRRVKYNDNRLFAHTRCVKCGREKRVFLSNLLNDPEKYGSCICSDTNIESRMDNIEQLYKGSKKLSSNTSGYTGVTFVKKYRNLPYNKWRAYIEVDGKRTYLGDFASKSKAIKARKAAAVKGVRWYKIHKHEFMKDARKRAKRYRTRRTRKFD